MKAKGFLIDLDGVLVKSEEFSPLPGAVKLIGKLKKVGLPFKIATSNSRYSPEELAERLKEAGFQNISPADIVSPLSVAPEYMKKQGVLSVFVIGSENLKNYLRKKGFKVEDSTQVDAVLVGMDKQLNFYKLKIATTAVKRNKGKLFALNGNLISKDSDGLLFPGVGSVAKMLSYACGIDFIHFGKMSDVYNRTIFEEIKLNPEEILMVSDDIFVDLKGYSSLGLKTAFLTTGKYTVEDIPSDFKPDYVFNSLEELIKELGLDD